MNDVFLEMNEKHGIETSTTPSEAPCSNGIVERNDKVLFELMMKTIDDCKCDLGTALAWAVCAKNCLQNVYRYSSNQLVFGSNVSLPSVITDLPPALVSTTSSDIIHNNLNAIHEGKILSKLNQVKKFVERRDITVELSMEKSTNQGKKYSIKGKS